ncbi:LysM peptidoglycan-binding domain-containing protein [Desulfovibrio sp. TomC]|uniref:LysM peptidoglycan-binding domain-containing protein n=1 Tax=Desulfovibrio sp. TomC TaxID=1562888 RepID=UPI000574DDC0|nr:LysM peptidoglycan-binding domain-containing protein [Desulfovibrio sp. TomC]KHK01440.1 Translation initiation factor 2 [Desulfovibrio sp. TomC]
MPTSKILVSLALLIFAVTSVASAGLSIYPADGPAPKIVVEQPKPLTYKVEKGDTVAVIAKKFGLDAKALLAANGLADAKKLKAGQTLTIPGKTAAPAAAPVAAPGAKTPQPAAADTAQAKTPAPLAAAPEAIKPDATARKGKSKEAMDPGVVEEKPVKGKKGKKGKDEPLAVPSPTVEVSDKMRASFGKTGVIGNTTDVPQAIRDEFWRYAQKWVDELDRLGVGTAQNKKIRQVGSQWEATYRVIIRDSLGAEVKRVEYDHTPYVGHITYTQRVYTSVAPTKDAALRGPWTEKDEAIREIFSYSGKNKAWR